MYLFSGTESLKKGEPENYMNKALNEFAKEYAFFVSLLWKKGEDKVIDLSYYSSELKENWKVNYEMQNWTYKNNLWQVVPGFTCEEGGMLFGREWENRRTCKDLGEFANKPLDIEFLNSLFEFRS